MTTAPAIQIQSVTETYQEEYYDKHAAKRKGFWGRVNKFFKFAEGTYNNRVISRLTLPTVVAGIVALSLAGVGLVVTAPLMLAACLVTAAVSIASLAVVERESNKNLKVDIANGTLTSRYVDEVLVPQQNAIRQLLDVLAQPQPPVLAAVAPLTEKFEAAAIAPAAETPAVEAVPTSKKTAVPQPTPAV